MVSGVIFCRHHSIIDIIWSSWFIAAFGHVCFVQIWSWENMPTLSGATKVSGWEILDGSRVVQFFLLFSGLVCHVAVFLCVRSYE